VFLSRFTGIGRSFGGGLEGLLSESTGIGRSLYAFTVGGAITTSGNVLGAAPVGNDSVRAVPNEPGLQGVLFDAILVD